MNNISNLDKLPETFRFAEAARGGVHSATLQRWLSNHSIERISRGVYRKTSYASTGLEDIVAVCTRVPMGVLCLESALYLHELGTQIPHRIMIAIDRKAWVPKIDYPATQFMRFSEAAYSEGIETIVIQGARLRIYSKEKTVADCFKFRNKIGEDVAIEALRSLIATPGFTTHELLQVAKICRVEKILRPYLMGAL